MITVGEIMTASPVTVQPATLLHEVIGIMKARSCRHLPVVDNDHLVGIVTDRDVRLAVNSPHIQHERAEEWQVLQTTQTATCMTPNPMTVDLDTPAVEAARLMNRYKFSALPVVADGRLVGIVTVSDILTSYIALLENVQGRS